MLSVLTIGSVGYILETRKNPKEIKIAAPAVATNAASKAESAAPLPPVLPEPAKPVPTSSAPSASMVDTAPAVAPAAAPAAASAMPPAVATPQPTTQSNRASPSQAAKRNGNVNLSSGQNPEEMKQNVRALGEVIKVWNAETDAQAAREKAAKK
jgi:hypothetical protein